MATNTSEPVKAKRDRSPAYPFISLKTAMDRLSAFESKFGRHPAPLDKAGLAWDLKADSSQAAQTLSAMKYFGLLEYAGATEHRAAVITEQARNYLRTQQATLKADMLKSFALKPKSMQNYWAKWSADRPIDEVCLDELMLKDSYTEVAAKLFLRVYDETIAFSGLAQTDKIASMDGNENQECETTPSPSPAAKERLTTNPFAVQPAALPQPSIQSFVGSVALKQDTFTLDEGPVVLQWPSTMSATSFEDFNDWISLQLRKIKRSISQ